MSSFYNADRDWVNDLESIFKHGIRSMPRDMNVYETLGFKSVVDMNSPIITIPERKLGYKFMAAEAAWILSGDDRVETIAPYSKEISKFSDDGVSFFGAYGPKVLGQINYVVDALLKDLDTRQAVINIWRESPGPSKDIPCTLSLQFILRNETLHCVASMRSSDLWLGHPYDIFNFSALSFGILLELQNRTDYHLKLGELHLTAGSKHIYERNVVGVSDIVEKYGLGGVDSVNIRREKVKIFDSRKYEDYGAFVSALWDAANSKHGAMEFWP